MNPVTRAWLVAVPLTAVTVSALTYRPCNLPHLAPVSHAESEQHAHNEPSLGIAETCVVTHITDGDTLRCGERRIRPLSIDAPESSQGAYGDSSEAALARLAPIGTTVGLEFDEERTDRYGRTLAYVYNEAGQMVNEEMVRQGYATLLVYPPNERHADRIGAAQAEARIHRRGLWPIGGFACTPKQHRKGEC